MSDLLTNALAAQLIGYHMGPQSPEVYDQKPTNIVFASNGVFRVVKTPVALFKVQLSEVKEKDSVIGLEAMTAGPELLIPKIPFRYLQMVLSWYRDVNTKDGTEASILFFWNHNNVELPTEYADGKPINGLLVDGQLVIYCPTQRNSSGLSEFHMDTMVTWLRENMALLCETHSHNTMNAFFSGTDNANENATQFYGVWGYVTKDEPAFAFRWVCGDAKIEVSPDVLFDWPTATKKTTEEIVVSGFAEPVVTVKEENLGLFKGPFAMIDYPDDWMPKHSKSAVLKTYPSTSGAYNRGAGAHNRGAQANKYPANGYDYPYQGYGGDWAGYGYEGYDDSHWAGHAHGAMAGGSKKLELVPREGPQSLAEADVIEVHTEEDVVNLKGTELEAHSIAEDLRDYGFDKVIEQAIDAAREIKDGQEKKAE